MTPPPSGVHPATPCRVGVVLLNWNGAEWTIPCIESLRRGRMPPWRILVFDNGSTDGSPDRIAQQCPDVELVRNGHNIGFAAGNNAGIRRLLALGAEFVWVLNNDTVVAPECLERLVEAMQSDPGIAAASGKIFFENPPDVLWYAGAAWTAHTLRPRLRGLREKDRGQYNEPCDVGMLSGCCMLVRRETFERLGYFNEKYFAYNEDAEWCLRAVKAAARLRYVPQAVLWHKQHATSNKVFGGSREGKASPRQEFFQARNSVFLLREHARRPFQLTLALLGAVARRSYRAAGLLALGRWRSSLAILNGLLEGLAGNYTVYSSNLHEGNPPPTPPEEGR